MVSLSFILMASAGFKPTTSILQAYGYARWIYGGRRGLVGLGIDFFHRVLELFQLVYYGSQLHRSVKGNMKSAVTT
jgi:hypothetical protein